MWQSPKSTGQSRRFRAEMTGAEAILWSMLRNRQLGGLKFRRQAPVAGAIADFACHEIRLIVELDGGVHDLHEARDAARDARIEAAGYTVLRFRNAEFSKNPAVVTEAIRRHAAMRTQPPHPTGSAGHLLPRGEKEIDD
ncbi:MAG: endonuclease domain-containing protein [Brevundimonas sp.]|uniref:endonuclease domain-containing protein n=1 Tax=Brevundimonas sp. TaxID=1871086 RepID=UPI00391B2CFB